MEITEAQKQRIASWGKRLDADVVLRYATSGHAMDPFFKAFVDQVVQLAPGVAARKDGDAIVSLPTLFPAAHVAYQALPLHRELDPFLALLADSRALAAGIDTDVRGQLSQLNAPAQVKVYITTACPHCPNAVSTLLGLSACSDQVRVTVIDGELFPEAAAKDRIAAAPTILLDDRFRWTGSIDAGELATLMLGRDPADLGADALRSMIEEGDAEGVAAMMAERGSLFKAFIDLLTHPLWSVRLGAMVAFETLAELRPDLAAKAADPLKAAFEGADATVKGDLLHVIGESGNRSALAFLEAVAAHTSDDDIHDAAREAIEKLK